MDVTFRRFDNEPRFGIDPDQMTGYAMGLPAQATTHSSITRRHTPLKRAGGAHTGISGGSVAFAVFRRVRRLTRHHTAPGADTRSPREARKYSLARRRQWLANHNASTLRLPPRDARATGTTFVGATTMKAHFARTRPEGSRSVRRLDEGASATTSLFPSGDHDRPECPSICVIPPVLMGGWQPLNHASMLRGSYILPNDDGHRCLLIDPVIYRHLT